MAEKYLLDSNIFLSHRIGYITPSISPRGFGIN